MGNELSCPCANDIESENPKVNKKQLLLIN